MIDTAVGWFQIVKGIGTKIPLELKKSITDMAWKSNQQQDTIQGKINTGRQCTNL
jgi:hypothetical protein